MDLPEHIRMDITTDNLPPNSISYASARMTSRSSGPMKSLNFPPYSKSSKEWESATRCTETRVIRNTSEIANPENTHCTARKQSRRRDSFATTAPHLLSFKPLQEGQRLILEF
ncbi:hypothetical protein AVEN_13341-1 [Araneus ventricosus]|uniref:Uncharacterized protein n=1 Tax=Araneus ventricosus TaxID=182803 RepID=A0A4Y2IIA4_ARAVE|nr:hypothetical protein AVEN_13341-1 [Araneus ventricosus]